MNKGKSDGNKHENITEKEVDKAKDTGNISRRIQNPNDVNSATQDKDRDIYYPQQSLHPPHHHPRHYMPSYGHYLQQQSNPAAHLNSQYHAAMASPNPRSTSTNTAYTQSHAYRSLFVQTSSINENDVLCGRGGLTNQHVGNKKFRALVKELQPKYMSRKKHEKTLLSQAVVCVVRSSTPIGRFLKQEPQSGMWYDIGDEMATEKTSQAFREKSSQLKTHAKNNDQTLKSVTSKVKTDDVTKKLKKNARDCSNIDDALCFFPCIEVK